MDVATTSVLSIGWVVCDGRGELERVLRTLDTFFTDGEVADKAREELFVNQELMEVANEQFRRCLIQGLPRNLYNAISSKELNDRDLKMQVRSGMEAKGVSWVSKRLRFC